MSPFAVRCKWGETKSACSIKAMKACAHLKQALHLVPDGREASPELHGVVGVNGVLQIRALLDVPGRQRLITSAFQIG